MPIAFVCPCRQVLQVPDRQAASPVRCPACGKVLIVPGGPVANSPPAAIPLGPPTVSRGPFAPLPIPPPLPPPARSLNRSNRLLWMGGLAAFLLVLTGIIGLLIWANRPSTPDRDGSSTRADDSIKVKAPSPLGPPPKDKPTREGKDPKKTEPPENNEPKEKDEKPADELTARVLEKVRALRRTAGLSPVVADPFLCHGCMAHAHYLARNLGKAPLLLTEEDRNFPVSPRKAGRPPTGPMSTSARSIPSR
jgi:hypothetical protein